MPVTSPDINPFPLGFIQPTPGTPVSITTKFSGGLSFTHAKALIAQAPTSNQGPMYVGRQNLNKAQGSGIISMVYPGETKSIPYDLMSGNVIDMSKFYVDCDVVNDGLFVSALIE